MNTNGNLEQKSLNNVQGARDMIGGKTKMAKEIKSFGLSRDVVDQLKEWKQTSPFAQSILVDLLLRDYFNLGNSGIILEGHKTDAIKVVVDKGIKEVNGIAGSKIKETEEGIATFFEKRLKQIATQYMICDEYTRDNWLALQCADVLPEQGINITKEDLLEKIQKYL